MSPGKPTREGGNKSGAKLIRTVLNYELTARCYTTVRWLVMGAMGLRCGRSLAPSVPPSPEWEVLSRHEFATIGAARATVIDWCYGFYNHQRRHSATAGMSPINC